MDRTAKLVAAAVIAVGQLALLPSTAQAVPIDFKVLMRGAHVVDPSGGDPDGSINASVSLDLVARRVCPNFSELRGLGIPTEVHLHAGAAGTNGPVLASFDVPPPEGGIGACVDVVSDVIDGILAGSTSYYLDLHTDEFPNGAIRGQLEILGCGLVAWGPNEPPGEGGAELYVREGDRIQVRGTYWEGAVVEFSLTRGAEVALEGTAIVSDWAHEWFHDLDYDDAGEWTFSASVPGVAGCEDTLPISVDDAGEGPIEPGPDGGPLPNTAIEWMPPVTPAVWIGIISVALATGAGLRRFRGSRQSCEGHAASD